MPREFSSHATAVGAGCQPHELRRWRAEGFLRGIGTREGKNILYTPREIACISVAVRLAACGLRYRDAFEYARRYENQIFACLGADAIQTKMLRLDIGASTNDLILNGPDDAPAARMTYHFTGVHHLASIEINLSSIARTANKRAAEYEAAHAGARSAA